MKIDLHCHTKKIKTGDGNERNVTPELFKEKITIADIKIVAITNHNVFDYNQYLTLKESVSELCKIWPGVELDVIGESKFHLIIISNPDSAEAFSNCVSKLFEGKDINTYSYSLDDIYETFKDFDCIYVPHFHDKRPAISINDRNKLLNLVNDDARVFIEPRNHRTLGVLSNKDYSVIIGSDVKKWSNYESCTFADLRLPVGNFSEFILLARRDKDVVNTLLNKKTPIDIIGHPHQSVNVSLKIYPDINIIFGAKGTGKSEILESLYEAMIANGKNCKKYIASDRSDDFSSLLKPTDMEVDIDKVNANSCDDEFRFISQWSDCNPTLFSNYINWIDTKGNSNSKSRMKITDAIHTSFLTSPSYEKHKNDKITLESVINSFKNIDTSEYISEDDIEHIHVLISRLYLSIIANRKNDLIEKLSVDLSNWSIDKIKAEADKNSDTISRPSTSDLKEFANNRIKLLHAINRILENIDSKEFNEKKKVGSLEDKGNIYVNYKYRMLCPESRAKNFTNKISDLKFVKEKLKYIKENIFHENLALAVEELNSRCDEASITSTKSFLGISKQIVNERGEVYEPSNGEKGILLLQRVLTEDADAYFLDEPELGMGNSYIDTDIRPLISNLAKQRKFVVIATHNANIAVRTLPYMSIFRTHENGSYKTYMGNPFDDILVNINDEMDTRSWTEESMHSLEGGYDAFYERRDIYESKDH